MGQLVFLFFLRWPGMKAFLVRRKDILSILNITDASYRCLSSRWGHHIQATHTPSPNQAYTRDTLEVLEELVLVEGLEQYNPQSPMKALREAQQRQEALELLLQQAQPAVQALLAEVNNNNDKSISNITVAHDHDELVRGTTVVIEQRLL